MKQAIREQIERKQSELSAEENMTKELDTQQTDLMEVLKQTAELNRVILEEKAADAKEKLEKRQQESAKREADALQIAQSAAAKAELDRQKREFCLHSTIHPATKQRTSAWLGQVNSDGYIVPLCNLCKLEMPKVKASDDQKANGVRFAEYSADQLTVDRFEKWHKSSFPTGCNRETCYVCHPVKELEAVAV
jgi:hypothetical protein